MEKFKIGEEFFDELKKEIKNEFSPETRDEFSLEIAEVIKLNDRNMHGVRIRLNDEKIAPTFYIEDITEKYDCRTIKDIANCIVTNYVMNIGIVEHMSECRSMSFNYEDIRDKLTVQLVDEDKNRQRLKKLMYKSLGNGYAMIPYIELQECDLGIPRVAVTKEIAERKNYDENIIFQEAIDNMMKKYEPCMFTLKDVIEGCEDDTCNPFSEGFVIDESEYLYALTNRKKNEGAAALFYPGIMERLSEIFDGDYFALPSSIHEFLILPESKKVDIQFMKDMVRDANEKVVEEDEILSEKVLKYDSSEGKIIAV